MTARVRTVDRAPLLFGVALVAIFAALLAPRALRVTHAPVEPAPASDALLLDINAASAAELQLLPGVGPAIAARVVEERETNGPFRDFADLQRTRGIGPRTAADIAPFLRFPAE